MDTVERPRSANPALNAYLNSCTHAVMVKFLGMWCTTTLCRGYKEARMVLKRQRDRSLNEYKIVKLEKS
jgi:hypothetical protein